ncbi:hypothetical protein DENSPDRAFT_713652 [Dentipellis sp. KUC8613]|nr:hypothetical protein DENSPDRAFT_713652 [Dentipellis sp. KUC8613]
MAQGEVDTRCRMHFRFTGGSCCLWMIHASRLLQPFTMACPDRVRPRDADSTASIHLSPLPQPVLQTQNPTPRTNHRIHPCKAKPTRIHCVPPRGPSSTCHDLAPA